MGEDTIKEKQMPMRGWRTTAGDSPDAAPHSDFQATLGSQVFRRIGAVLVEGRKDSDGPEP